MPAPVVPAKTYKHNQKTAMHLRLLILLLSALLLRGHMCSKALAQEAELEPINFAYAAWIGSGYYQLEDRDLYVLRLPIAIPLRSVNDDSWRISLLLPVIFAYEQFNSNFLDYITDDILGAAFVPGVEVQIPVSKNWTLKPFGQIGIGYSESTTTYIYGGGIKSLYSFQWDRVDFGLGNSLVFADEDATGNSEDEGFSMFQLGLDARHLINFSTGNRDVDIGSYVVVSRFLDTFDFFGINGDVSQRIRTLVQIGLTLGIDPPVTLLGIDFSRVGIDYTFGKDFSGIGLNLGFPF
jgi:hypothetical protein